MNATMSAVVVENGAGPADALKVATVQRPEPGPGEILIRVIAAGVNRPDIFQRLGGYPPPPGASEILGLEVAGEVVTPAGRWKQGDRVCALLGGGGYAEFARCDARHALPAPPALSLVEAAGLPETLFTVYANLFEHGRLAAGETVLVHGSTSGIGVTAIQMARAAGARVIATARGRQKREAALWLGADIAVDTSAADFAKEVADAGGVDVVLDMVGAPYFASNLSVLKPDGRIVFIAALGGDSLQASVRDLMRKRVSITGSALRPRSADEKARLAVAVERTVWPWIETGKVTPVIDAVFPLSEASGAHARMEGGKHIGKIVLQVA